MIKFWQIELKNGKIHSLSFGHYRPERWRLAIYSTDYSSFLSHVYCNINRALEDSVQSLVCTYKADCEKSLPTNLAEDYWQTHIVLLEKRLQ